MLNSGICPTILILLLAGLSARQGLTCRVIPSLPLQHANDFAERLRMFDGYVGP